VVQGAPVGQRLIGAAVRRREDAALLRGDGRFVDDVPLPKTAAMAVLRSPHGHAVIRAIDTHRAAALPGVLAVLTARDLEGRVAPEPPIGVPSQAVRPPRPLLATDRVRYVGEPVAAVIAENRYVAADALEAIRVDYDPLPAVADPEAALEPGAPQLHPEAPGNVAYRWSWSHGDVDGAFARAHAVVSLRLVNQRLAAVAMETRALLAEYRGGTLTVWAGTQAPHRLRSTLAVILKLPESSIRVIAPDVGGGFGVKGSAYRDDAVCAFAALSLGRPVKLVLTRAEDFTSTVQGRGQVNDVEAAAAADGTVLAIRCRTLADLGAYLEALTAYPGVLTGRLLTGPYRIPAARYELTSVFTNAMSTAPYRGAGRPEAAYLVERTMDAVARRLGLDPAEVRRRNLLRPEQFPYPTPSGLVYDSGQYEAALDRALELVGYARFREEQRTARAAGRLLGIGFSCFTETAGVGPSKLTASGGWESGAVRVEPTGKVTVLTGTSPHGQGLETVFAQIAADGLGVPMEDVAVLHGDTAVVSAGVGTFGSRSVSVGGPAITRSIDKVVDKARRIAASLLEAAAEDIVFSDGRFAVRGSPDRAVTLQSVAAAAYAAKGLPDGMEPGLEATTVWDPPNFTFPFGAYICVVDIDVDTGESKTRSFYALDDCGTRINPMIIEGQIHGGLTEAFAVAMGQQLTYDEQGNLLSGSLMDYFVPTAVETPKWETDYTVTPSPHHPIGAKGVAESPHVGGIPCFSNAVNDALSQFGITHVDMPHSAFNVWKTLHANGLDKR